MPDYFLRNRFPKIKKDFLKSETFEKLKNYINSEEFKSDMEGTYWEGKYHTSNLISFLGELKNNYYENFKMEVRDDEDLDKENLDINKLKKHYKILLDIIFESE